MTEDKGIIIANGGNAGKLLLSFCNQTGARINFLKFPSYLSTLDECTVSQGTWQHPSLTPLLAAVHKKGAY